MKHLSLLIIFLSGCFSRPSIPGSKLPDGPADGSGPFEHIAYWGSYMAGLAVLIGIIILWRNVKLGQQVIVTAISVLIGAQLMIWISCNLWWISIITLACGLAYVSYKHRDKIMDVLDGDE